MSAEEEPEKLSQQRVGDRFAIAIYHPAAALHPMALKPASVADFARLPERPNEARAKSRGRNPLRKKKIIQNR